MTQSHLFNPVTLKQWMQPQKGAWVTIALIAANAVVFLLMVLDSNGEALGSPGTTLLVKWQADWGPLTLGSEPWRVLTCCFVHIGTIHLLFNMVVLWQVARVCEPVFGHLKYALLYFVTGISASILSLLVKPNIVSAGASGAICGLIGAYAAFLVAHRKEIEPAAFNNSLKALGFYMGYVLIYGFFVHADHAAHIGGLAVGFILGLAWIPQPKKGFRLRDGLAAIVVAGLAAAVFVCECKGLSDVTGEIAFAQAGMLFEKGDLAGALAKIESMNSNAENSDEVKQLKASIFIQSNHPEKAAPIVQSLLTKPKKDPKTLLHAAQLAWHAQDFQSAAQLSKEEFAIDTPQQRPYSAFLYFLASKRTGAASPDQLIEQCNFVANPDKWQAKIASYLLGRSTSGDLIAAAQDFGQRTEAHAYVGLNLQQQGHTQEAKEQLDWVAKNGARTYIEYFYAISELKHL